MTIPTRTPPARLPLVLAMASTFGLAACGSDGDDGTDASASASSSASAVVASGDDESEPTAAVDVSTDTSGPDDVVDDPTGTPPDEDPAEVEAPPGDDAPEVPVGQTPAEDEPTVDGAANAADDIDLSDAAPRFNVGECGALPVQETAASVSLDAPATLVEGQLVRGGADPDVVGNEVNYWQVELQPGYHHLIVDAERLDRRNASLTYRVDDVDAAGDSNDLLLNVGASDFRTRSHEFFVNPEARTVTLAIAPGRVGVDYVFGVFANGRAIPSPFFEDCPEIAASSVGTTEAVLLRELELPQDYAWYRMDLPRGRYTFDGTASRADGSDRSITYTGATFHSFGQASTRDLVINVGALGPVTTDQDTFAHPAVGPVWLRLAATRADLNLQFTLSPED